MKKYLLLLAIVTLGACDQEPYPENVATNLVDEIRDPQINIPKPHALAVDSVIEYTEGRQTNYKLVASVDAPGKPILIAENLPPGAKFNTETFELTWKPDYFAANDINKPTVKVRDYGITFELSSTVESDRDKRRFDVILRVKDNPRGVRVERDKKTTVNEGDFLRSTITIKDNDFPDGPFNLEIKDVPADVEIIKDTETSYRIIYAPSHDIVSFTRDKKTVKQFKGILTVTNPRGGRTKLETPIIVRDKRLDPIVTPPNRVTQSLDVSLQVFAKDENSEIPPEISMTSDNPSFGDFSTELVEDPKTNSSVLAVNWSNIPPSKNGKKYTLEFETCVFSKVNVKSRCVYSSTEVTIKLRDRKPPKIDRSNWKVGELVYLGFDRSFYRSIDVTDREDSDLTPKVEVFPKKMRKFVRWTVGGSLKVGPFKKAGTFQFSLVATSDYNVSSAESFIVEVFPEDRKKVLFFADSTRDPEALFYKSEFDAQMMNPAIQVVSKRNISNRETLIITTSTLLDKSNQSVIMDAIETIPNVVVASPLIENLPVKFLKDLRDNYDLDVIGRYSQVAANVPLNSMFFEKTSQFQDTVNPVGLMGLASSESKDPVIFNGGLYDPNKNCKSVLGITPDGNNPLVVGVVCDRLRKKGRVTLMGTEWADLKVSADDKGIPSSWFKTMIKGSF